MAGWYSGLGATVVAVAVVIGLRTLRQRFAVVTVTGKSMQPTLIAGDRVLVRRRDIRELQSGQIVVFRRPASDSTWQTEPPRSADGRAQWAIKRLAAIPGDPLPAEILAAADCNPELLVPGLVVPCQKLFVIGDNVDGSFDSRHFGYVPAEHLLGVVHSRLRLRQQHVLHRNPADPAERLAAPQSSGRVADRTVTGALGWRGGDRLTLTAEAGVVVIRRHPAGLVTLPPRSCVPIPAALRHRCGLLPEIPSFSQRCPPRTR